MPAPVSLQMEHHESRSRYIARSHNQAVLQLLQEGAAVNCPIVAVRADLPSAPASLHMRVATQDRSDPAALRSGVGAHDPS